MLGVLACAVAACGVLSPEEQLLSDFFEAARVYDTTVMARLSAAPLNPRTDGIIDSFTVEGVDHTDAASERVTITARVRRFDGEASSRQFVFTLTRLDGRWFIKDWRPADGTP